MTFGDKLRELMDENNLNQRQLAEKLNISAPALGNYIRNIREPDFETLKRIAAYFHISIDYLLDYKPINDNNPKDSQLLHLFHNMTSEQQELFLAQGLVYVKYNKKNKTSDDTK